jgi:hypothetical protein
MPTKTMNDVSSNVLLREMLLIAEEEFINRRSERRFPFFRPILVEVDDKRYPAFTREICSSGMGLVHNVRLPLEKVSLKFEGRPHNLSLLIERCELIGDGWYCSGGKFVGGVVK